MLESILYILILSSKLLFSGANTSSFEQDDEFLNTHIKNDKMHLQFKISELEAIGPIIVDEELRNFIYEKCNNEDHVFGYQAYEFLKEFVLIKLRLIYNNSGFDTYQINRRIKFAEKNCLLNIDQFIFVYSMYFCTNWFNE